MDNTWRIYSARSFISDIDLGTEHEKLFCNFPGWEFLKLSAAYFFEFNYTWDFYWENIQISSPLHLR
jgi:hypothetical protein